MNNIRVPEGQTLGGDRDITDEAKDRDLLAHMAAILLSGATVWPQPMKDDLCKSAVATARKILAAVDAETAGKTTDDAPRPAVGRQTAPE